MKKLVRSLGSTLSSLVSNVLLLAVATCAVAEEIAVHCSGTAASGDRKASFPSKFAATIVIDTEKMTVDGAKPNILEISSTNLRFHYSSHDLAREIFNIDRTTGRFVYGNACRVIYEGSCEKSIREKRF